jgi:glycosyltransferase involved in cell wall biosynthesis/predicted GH43/DUF377 family glycosyl hydrolase
MNSQIKVLILLVFAAGVFLGPQRLMGTDANTKICLTMIVKNEEMIIERCLNNVKGVVDCISICDTGSSDKTVQVIENFLKETGIPGKVHRHKWVNFGHNRTHSVLAAQKMLADFGFPLDNSYLLLIDADMVLVVDPSFSKESLLHDSYSVIQTNTSQSYGNTRLIRASLPWECKGVTHEYWSCKADCREVRLPTLRIDDRNDGGCKADKFERDIRLLTQGLQDEPENERYMFYLAQSYHALRNYEDACKWYKARIRKGGWYEEVGYSKFMLGQTFEDMGDWDRALHAYLDAYQYNPARAEPLHKISSYYRKNQQHNLAYLFAKHGTQVPFPIQQDLFIAYPIYDYLFDEDISISAYYTPFKEEGFAATNRLILNKNVPGYVKEQAYKNIVHYVPNLMNASYQPVKIDLPRIREGFEARFNPMNPSIRKTEKGYDLICRTVNYITIEAKHFKTMDLLDPTNKIITRNFLVQYDPDFKLLSQQEIIDELPRKKTKYYNMEGLEDCRIFAYNNSTWFTCTTTDTNPCGQHQVSLCKLEDGRSSPIAHVERLIPLIGPNPDRCEKNWLPFVVNGQLHMIYSYDPLIIYRPEINKTDLAICVETRNEASKYDFSRFSGSAPPIPFDDGFLLLIHETVFDDKRIYLHRFVFLDKNLNIKQISKPFIFLHKGVEYCCGITLDHSATKLVMSIGIEDREAYLCHVDLKTVRSLLEPLP